MSGKSALERNSPGRAKRLASQTIIFEEIWIVDVPFEHDPNQRHRAVAWSWKNHLRQPFPVRYWGRSRSFHLTRPKTDGDRLSQVRALKGMARCTGLHLGVPRAYIDHLGAFDLSGHV